MMEFFNFRKKLTGHELKKLLCYIILGLIMSSFFYGKPYLSVYMGSIAVSPNEQYIACYEASAERRILCLYADGSTVFTYNIPVDLSAGGNCSLWFEDDALCAFFYRTHKMVCFTSSGSIQSIVDSTVEKYPPKFPSFSRKGHQYVFDGDKINVVYDDGSFLGYLLFGSERSLAITPTGGETKMVFAWTAKDGINEKID